MITSLLWLRRRRYTHRVSFGCNPRVLTWKITVKDITTNNAQQGAHIMKPLSETYKVSYIDWQDDEGNCGTSYAIILEAESEEEAEVELSTFLPPLPKKEILKAPERREIRGYTAAQMMDYANAAVSATWNSAHIL